MSTYLLVHGAWHSGRAWDRVVPLLTAAGHRVFAPSLTGYGDKARLLGPEVGLDTHVDDVVGLITDEDLTDVVLVGHSYAGLVVSGVVNRVPDRIAQLVYLDAMVPVDGEAATDIMPVTQVLIDLAARSDTPWRIPPLPELPPPGGLFGVTDPDDVAWLRTMVSTSRHAASSSPSTWTTPPRRPSRAPTSTAWAANRRASSAGPSPRSSPTAARHRCGSWRPATTA